MRRNSWIFGWQDDARKVILSVDQIWRLARSVWPQFKGTVIPYLILEELMKAWGEAHNLIFDPNYVIKFWIQSDMLKISPDGREFRLLGPALEKIDEWEEEDRLWNSGQAEPMPMVTRLVAGEPFRNQRKIQELVGASTVTGIHDPFTTAPSLTTIHKLADMETKFDKRLRLLGTPHPLKNPTEKTSLVSLLNDLNKERNTRWEIRTYTDTSRPHRRFLVLDDGAVVTCGMSLNHIDKNEVLDREPSGSQYARHDIEFFEEYWKKGTPI